MSILLLGLELYFAAMLGVSGLAKVGQPAMFADTLRRHKILPSWSIKAVSTIVPWLEIAVAVLLITGLVPILTGLLVLFLFTSFLIMESILVATGRATECGCYGLAYPQKVDRASIITSTILVCAASFHLWGIFQVAPIGIEWRIVATILMGGAGGWLIWRMWLKRKRQPSIIRVVIPSTHSDLN